MVRRLAVFLTAILLAGTVAHATVADDLCAPTDDPCIPERGETVVVDPGSVLDFGARDFIMPPGSGTRLDIGTGTVTLKAGSITLNAGSGITGAGGTVTVESVGDIRIARDGNSRARIDVADDLLPGDVILRTTNGDIIIDGIVDARGKSTDALFGSVIIEVAGDLLLDGEILATGLGLAGGGDVSIIATGEINIPGIIDVSGSDGGTIDLTAMARIVTDGTRQTARLDARASFGGGSGGEISVTSPANVTLGSTVHLQGENSQDFGGDGGFLTIVADRTIALTGDLNVFGTFPDGIGGEVDFAAGLDIIQTGHLSLIGKPVFGVGGSALYLAERNLVLGSVDVSGDCLACDGGEIDAQAWCSLIVPATSVVNALGAAGTVIFEAGETLTIGGTITSGGTVDLFYHPNVGAPNLAGSTITPAPLLLEDANVVPCGGPPGLNCGDNVVDPDEECDDDNLVSCDGCSSICFIEAPGNGRIDCGEVCDDGNTTACDGCAPDFSREDDICGDGLEECGEECDDENSTACDGCSTLCMIERCGNGFPECDEECDLGDGVNGTPEATCDAGCLIQIPASCGDGNSDPGEACDDGNSLDCDGCSSLCVLEACGNGSTECAEECDDFNVDACDGCSTTCIVEECGNGIIDCGEECDDGVANGTPESDCLPELCTRGTLCTPDSDGPCIPCGDDLDCDQNGRCGSAGLRCTEGVCEASPLDCDDQNPCTIDTCDPVDGCTHALQPAVSVPECTPDDGCDVAICDAELGCQVTSVAGFDRVRCRLDTLQPLLQDPTIEAKIARKLLKLHTKAGGQLDKAEAGDLLGKIKKVKKGLKKTGKLLTKLQRKVVKFADRLPPSLATDIDAGVADGLLRVQQLQIELQV